MERSLGRKGYLDLVFRQTEGVERNPRKVHPKTNCLVRVGVGRSDGSHESNSSCQTIAKVPSLCRTKVVFMMGIDKSVQ